MRVVVAGLTTTFARVTTKTTFMIFKKLRIIQQGVTTNYAQVDKEWYPLAVTDAAIQSVVALGNQKPIHCRKTHGGQDMLDGYLGKFTNFVYEDGVAYADLELSVALQRSYPQEASFIANLIKDEPEMLGVSVVGDTEEELKDGIVEITRFVDLYSCDLVGLPAATTSLFNKNQKEKKMNKFFSAFADAFKKKSSFATEVVSTKDGGTITIEAAGEAMAVGDKVFDSEGNAVPDGEITIVVDDAEAVIVVEGGVIKEVKSVAPEEVKVPEVVEEVKTEDVPYEFTTRIAAIEKAVSEMGKQFSELMETFSKTTKKPSTTAAATPKKEETQMSRKDVNAAAMKFLKK